MCLRKKLRSCSLDGQKTCRTYVVTYLFFACMWRSELLKNLVTYDNLYSTTYIAE